MDLCDYSDCTTSSSNHIIYEGRTYFICDEHVKDIISVMKKSIIVTKNDLREWNIKFVIISQPCIRLFDTSFLIKKMQFLSLEHAKSELSRLQPLLVLNDKKYNIDDIGYGYIIMAVPIRESMFNDILSVISSVNI